MCRSNKAPLRTALTVIAFLAACLSRGSAQPALGVDTPQSLLAKLQASNFTNAKTSAGALIIVTADDTINTGSFGTGTKRFLFVSRGIGKLPHDEQVAAVGYAMATAQLAGANKTDETDAESLDKLVLKLGVPAQSIEALLKSAHEAAMTAATPQAQVAVPAPSAPALQERISRVTGIIEDDETHDDNVQDLTKFRIAAANKDVKTLRDLAVKYPKAADDLQHLEPAVANAAGAGASQTIRLSQGNDLKAGEKFLGGAHAPPNSNPANLVGDYETRIAQLAQIAN